MSKIFILLFLCLCSCAHNVTRRSFGCFSAYNSMAECYIMMPITTASNSIYKDPYAGIEITRIATEKKSLEFLPTEAIVEGFSMELQLVHSYLHEYRYPIRVISYLSETSGEWVNYIYMVKLDRRDPENPFLASELEVPLDFDFLQIDYRAVFPDGRPACERSIRIYRTDILEGWLRGRGLAVDRCGGGKSFGGERE